MHRASVALAFTALLSACTVENSVDRQTFTDSFLQEPDAEVDILWVVDDSPSMAEEQALLGYGFGSFIESIEQTNIDFHIGVITTDMDLDNPDRGALMGPKGYLTPDDDYINEFRDLAQVGTDGSDKEKGLSAALYALTEPMASGTNAGFMRDDATLSIVFVSDEDDCSDGESLSDQDAQACYSQRSSLIPVKDFIQDYRALKGPGGRVLLSSVVGPDVADACPDSWPGHRYGTVSETTGGVVSDICEPDYSELMTDLGLAVSGLIEVFQLSYAAVAETIEVSVDDQIVLEDPVYGWTYDAEYWTLRFDGDYVPERGSNVSVSYEIAGR